MTVTTNKKAAGGWMKAICVVVVAVCVAGAFMAADWYCAGKAAEAASAWRFWEKDSAPTGICRLVAGASDLFTAKAVAGASDLFTTAKAEKKKKEEGACK